MTPTHESLQLPFSGALHRDWLLTFLARRALPGLERVQGDTYSRRLGKHWIKVVLDESCLRVQIPKQYTHQREDILARAWRLFNLDACSEAIDAHLGQSAALSGLVKAAPGIRVPGVWDSFEGAVKGILGQQISVERSIILASRLIDLFGNGNFPTPTVLATADVSAVGMPGIRGEAIRQISHLVVRQGDDFLSDPAKIRALRIKGIGPWTKEYIALRVAKDPDAFPASDRVLCNALNANETQALHMAEAWRPWRAYATMHLWRTQTHS